jgi:hypothetical protein
LTMIVEPRATTVRRMRAPRPKYFVNAMVVVVVVVVVEWGVVAINSCFRNETQKGPVT